MPNEPKADRPLRLPPANFDQRLIPRRRQVERKWFRVERADLTLLAFGLAPHHRFSHPDCPYPVLYLGSDPATCLWERFGDVMFDGSHTIPRNQWAGSVLTEIRVPELSVCDLADARVRAAITVDTSALTSNDFSVTHAWGLAIQRHPAGFQAIKYVSRFIRRPCLALFDRDKLKAHLKATRVGNLAQLDVTTDWLARYKVSLV